MATSPCRRRRTSSAEHAQREDVADATQLLQHPSADSRSPLAARAASASSIGIVMSLPMTALPRLIAPQSRVASASAARPSSPGHARAGAPRGSRVDEVLELALQRLVARHVQLAALDATARRSCAAPAATPRLPARRSRSTRTLALEEPDLAHAIAADAAGGEVGDAAAREPQARVGDVDRGVSTGTPTASMADDLVADDRRAARSSRGSSGRRRRRCRGCARGTCPADALR